MMGEPFLAILFWALAALLLVLAVIADAWALSPARTRWNMLAAGAAAGAAMALVVALLVLAATHGPWWQAAPAAPSLNARQVLLSLALATLVIRLALAWRLQVNVASLVVSLLALAGILMAGFFVEVSELPLGCARGTVPLQLQWLLFLIGVAGLAVAGSTGLALAFRAGLAPNTPNLQWPRWIELHALLRRASQLVLVALGAGIAASYWWSWRLLGVSMLGQPGEGWVILALLLAAMSYLARGAGGRWGRWSAGFVMIAAVIAILGLLAALDLPYDLRV